MMYSNQCKERFMKLIIAILFSLSFSSSVFAKGDAKKGKLKSMTCAACHGMKGVSTQGKYPNLAGQKEVYLLAQLKAFKAGVRKSPEMKPMVSILTPKDMENVAAYYASLK